MRRPTLGIAALAAALAFASAPSVQAQKGPTSDESAAPAEPTLMSPDAPHDATVPRLAFIGVDGPNIAAVPGLAFHGWPPLEPVEVNQELTFEGWGGAPETINTNPLAFTGWGGGPDAVAVSSLELRGWGDDLEGLTTSQLVFTGLGPTVEITETFGGAANGGITHGWTANDGPDALLVSKAGALCVRDFEHGDVTLILPERFLGDWGAGSGTLSFRVYYTGPIQWPAVVTLRSPHGHALWRPSLGTWNDAGYADVEQSLNDIWWEYVGDFGLIRRSVESVEITLDLKDGNSGDIEACIDDVVLTLQPID